MPRSRSSPVHHVTRRRPPAAPQDEPDALDRADTDRLARLLDRLGEPPPGQPYRETIINACRRALARRGLKADEGLALVQPPPPADAQGLGRRVRLLLAQVAG